MGNTKSTDEAVKHVMKERFGDKYATRSVSDIGSAKEAVSQGYNIIEGGSMSKAEWDAAKRAGLIRSSHDIAPTEPTLDPFDIIPPENWTNKMQSYASLIEL